MHDSGLDELAPGTCAVDLPTMQRRRGPPVPGAGSARRHRRLTGLSGLLLFACMFLPAVKGCHQPVMAYEVPPFLPPYLYGLVFALTAIVWSRRGLALAMLALRVLGSLVVVASVVLVVIAPPIGVIELMIGALLLVTVGMFGTSEPRIVASGVMVGVVSVVWFGCWAVTPDALIGVYLALVSSVGLLAGCLAWLRELVHRSPVDMPLAVAAYDGAARRRR
ncbi:MAG: hypothetical protein E6J90_42065 [Deltaproteobacteria bacterium]|nr:MAG: hypothetical protein E6J90_42065 [Deltaproteobacteria bacterium]TMQ14696.1 MAG: hypothetical protein E6J91_14785 [Deltaproteobacteria bacterium]